MKKALVLRPGAFGDVIILTPVFRKLKELGYKTYAYVGARGKTVLENNPNVDEIILYEKEGDHNPDIQKDFDAVTDNVNPDWVKNFSESIEVNVVAHPRSPAYIYPKNERRKIYDKNYYEATGKWADLDLGDRILPEVYFTNEEIAKAKENVSKEKFTILWCMSGSGANKAYPWVDYVMGEVLKELDDVEFITVGDEKCQMIETIQDERVKNLSGKIGFRDSMALTHCVDLVVSPDTGILHASGACSVPKIGILGHTTIENITKHFINDYSLEADENLAECSPCFRLIYDHKVQCPVDNLSGAAWCMSHGQPAARLKKRIIDVYKDCSKRIAEEKLSCV